jgi:hypothetical protein
VDTYNSIGDLKGAHAKAQKKLNVGIALEQPATTDAPYEFEDRLEELDLQHKYLKVWVPEVHDLILMKTMRAYDHDLEVIQQIVEEKENEVKLDVLVDRLINEMTHVIGEPERIKGNFLAVVERS